MEISYTDVQYIAYPTNTFNALRRCTSLFVDALRISQYFQSCQVFLSSCFFNQYQAEDNWGLVQGNKMMLRGVSN